jgi:hypothetical protein
MNKTDVLNTIQSAHASLEELLAPLSESQLCTPTLEGQRSIKDILAHIADCERLCAGWIEVLLRNETPDTPDEDEDTLNERIFQENRNRPLHEVQEDFQAAYQQFLRQVRALFQILPEEDLNDPTRFSWLEGRPLLALIAGNSYDHYQEHAEQVRSWLHTTKANGDS